MISELPGSLLVVRVTEEIFICFILQEKKREKKHLELINKGIKREESPLAYSVRGAVEDLSYSTAHYTCLSAWHKN